MKACWILPPLPPPHCGSYFPCCSSVSLSNPAAFNSLRLCLCRTSRSRWLCSLRDPSGSAGVWNRSRSPLAAVSLTDMFGWLEPPACISTSSAATTTLWRATCSGHRSTRRTRPALERFATSGLVFQRKHIIQNALSRDPQIETGSSSPFFFLLHLSSHSLLVSVAKI